TGPTGGYRVGTGRLQLVVRLGPATATGLAEVSLVLRALVVHEMVAASKSAHALFAFERLLALVDQHVGLQLVGVGESTGAQFAGIGSLPGVDPQMAPQVGHLHELAVAVG